MNSRFGTGFLFAAIMSLTPVAQAGEVKITHQGLTLNASLELAPGKTVADGVMLITHGMLAHGGMELIATLQGLLKEKGWSSLAINLGLGIDDRKGMYDCALPHTHRHTDALDEIGSWLDWLEAQGAKSVVLLGHSQGGNQTARFVAERDRPTVSAVVLLAPATWDEQKAANGYAARHKQPLKTVYERAQARVAAGKGEARLERTGFLYCADATVTAASFVSYYAPDTRRDTPTLLPKIAKPVLVVAASQDEIVPDVHTRTAAYADGRRVQLKVIEGADHFFRDLYAEDTVEAIAAFLPKR
jgi:pimeloyl-ACP methyl ester carboxylesterase